MDMFIALVGAAAVVVAGFTLLYVIMNDAHGMPLATCAPDGTAITSEDRLRVTVMMLDHTIATGRAPDGRKSDMLQTRAVADEFARQQVSPDVTLAMLEQCDQYLLHDYQHGFWLLSSALVREAARRRGAK